MQLDGFNEQFVLDQALAAGFASVELYVQNLLDRDAERIAIQEGLEDLKAGRVRHFDEFDREFQVAKRHCRRELMYPLHITRRAEADIESSYHWWLTNRSAEQANRWYQEIWMAIRSLRQSPERCRHASESDLHPTGLRELLFGIGRRPTHRIVFTIEEGEIRIVRVRHTSQRVLGEDDLT